MNEDWSDSKVTLNNDLDEGESESQSEKGRCCGGRSKLGRPAPQPSVSMTHILGLTSIRYKIYAVLGR